MMAEASLKAIAIAPEDIPARWWKPQPPKRDQEGSIRRIDALCDCDLEGTKQCLGALPQALETSAETVKHALDEKSNWQIASSS